MERKQIKMTDNDIIKDLNRCANTNVSFCKECTHRNCTPTHATNCCIQLMKSALDLINRQRKQIEEMHQDVKAAEEYAWQMRTARVEVITDFAERLKEAFPQSDRNNKCPSLYFDDYIEIIEQLAEEMKGGEKE